MSELKKLQTEMSLKLSVYGQLRHFWVKEVTLAQVSLETYLDILDKASIDSPNYSEAVLLAKSVIESVYTDQDVDELEAGALFLKSKATDNVIEIYETLLAAVDSYMLVYKKRYPLEKKRGLRPYSRNIKLIEDVYIGMMLGYFRFLYRKINLERYIVQHVIYDLSEGCIAADALPGICDRLTQWLDSKEGPDATLLNDLGLSIDVLINYELHDNFNQKLTHFLSVLNKVD